MPRAHIYVEQNFIDASRARSALIQYWFKECRLRVTTNRVRSIARIIRGGNIAITKLPCNIMIKLWAQREIA